MLMHCVCAHADELVAIKAVDATRFRSITEIEQVQEEMAVLATLKHPNIIRLLEVHFVNSCFYFVMEYASGGSMVRYIYSQEGGRLSESQARQLFGQILSALEYCHKRYVPGGGGCLTFRTSSVHLLFAIHDGLPVCKLFLSNSCIACRPWCLVVIRKCLGSPCHHLLRASWWVNMPALVSNQPTTRTSAVMLGCLVSCTSGV